MALIKEEDCPEGLPGWLATFGDLMSLLLTFFVLLLSFSSTSVKEFNSSFGAMQGALGVLSGEPQLNLPIRQSQPKTEGNLQQAQAMSKAGEEIETAVEQAGLQGDVKIEETASGLVIRVTDKLFFNSANSELESRATELLDKLGAVMKPLPNKINVQGHTDNRPINSDQYASNWELSGMRALQVARYFIEKTGISPDRLSITGYSEYRPLVPNNTPERLARNRRVEIHILYDSSLDASPGQIYENVEKQGISLQGRKLPEEQTPEGQKTPEAQTPEGQTVPEGQIPEGQKTPETQTPEGQKAPDSN